MPILGLFFLAFSSFGFLDLFDNVETDVSVQEKYEALTGCQKSEFLWSKIQDTKYDSLPELEKFGFWELWRMAIPHLLLPKVTPGSDFSPKPWTKFIHKRGTTALVEFVPNEAASKYSGLFSSGPLCGLLRLSVTFRPDPEDDRGFAPGLALKIFRDGAPSANVSALVSLEGQGGNHNFFAAPLTNIVPEISGLGAQLVRRVFSKYSDRPEEVKIENFFSQDLWGKAVESPVSARQIFFVPKAHKTSEEAHDFRESLAQIPEGEEIYEVKLVPAEAQSRVNYDSYTEEEKIKALEIAETVGVIKLKSSFVASSYGDDRILYRHQISSR